MALSVFNENHQQLDQETEFVCAIVAKWWKSINDTDDKQIKIEEFYFSYHESKKKKKTRWLTMTIKNFRVTKNILRKIKVVMKP